MPFALGKKTLANLTLPHPVHPVLLDTTQVAISISLQDFGVTEPQVRDLAIQRAKVNAGVSQTMESNHLQQPDLTGRTKTLYGHAEDLVPWVNGNAFTWDWKYIWPIAAAMGEAARQKGIAHQFCWGAVWDRWMSEYIGTGPAADQSMHDYLVAQAKAMEVAEQDYVKRRQATGHKRVFVDGPHFQFMKRG